MNANKDGDAGERTHYAFRQLVRDVIVMGGVGAAILWLGDNGYIASGSAFAALGVWRVMRPLVLERLP